VSDGPQLAQAVIDACDMMARWEPASLADVFYTLAQLPDVIAAAAEAAASVAAAAEDAQAVKGRITSAAEEAAAWSGRRGRRARRALQPGPVAQDHRAALAATVRKGARHDLDTPGPVHPLPVEHRPATYVASIPA
jgi:hypothetical protein